MNDESLDQFERQIASMQTLGAPVERRGAVLDKMQRELRASRWDRRLGRAAAVLLVLGVGMNTAVGLRSSGFDVSQVARTHAEDVRPTLVETAIVVAEATDAATAKQFARQMAAMSGRKLSEDEAAAIDVAVRRPAIRSIPGNRG